MSPTILAASSLAVALVLTVLATADDFPTPLDTEKSAGAPLPPAEAAAAFRVPEGFRVQVFAAEPDVRNPIAMAWDSRGRLWVAENYTYAERPIVYDLSLRDRVLIFEDFDGDGRHDRRSVFLDDVQRLTGVEPGLGGVWLMCPPRLLFVPDRDGDDRPDGPPEVVLDGFGVPNENHHTIANGLKWGPDGWLYGRCGASSIGRIGRPGTPDDRRIPLHGGVWRYHPRRKTFEVIAHGTTNPWGHDWDRHGELFFINTVNGHLWHAVPGMHLARPHSIDPNPHVYELIDQHADHYHWDSSKDWTDSREPGGEHDRRGGGHAHAGLMIYRGDGWPEEYRDRLFTLNLHGRRINADRLERDGSGFVGSHQGDPIRAGDPWFRGIDLASGPDGGVFVLDWSDFGECHEQTGVHRSSGRIYKIFYETTRRVEVGDLGTLGVPALVGLHRHPNAWHVRQARRVLLDRAARGEPMDEVTHRLRELGAVGEDLETRLAALGTLAGLDAIPRAELLGLLDDEHETIRAWGVRLLTDAWPLDDIQGRRGGPDIEPPSEVLDRLARLAREDDSGLVRLWLASTLQRLPHAHRPALAAPLLARAEDAGDHNVPLLLWYGLSPLAESDPVALARLAARTELPTTRRLIARRLAEAIADRPEAVDALLAPLAAGEADDREADLLAGLAEGLRGLRRAEPPSGWDAIARRLADHPDATLRDRARDLGVVFGDGRALEEVRRLALDDSADLDTRRLALRTLIEARPNDLRATCERLLKVRHLNAEAARGLALLDDPEIGWTLAASYRAFHPSDRPALLDALASRPGFAPALLDRIADGSIPRGDLGAFRARQIRSYDNPELTAWLEAAWGSIRSTDAARREQADRLRARLTPEALAQADLARGRAVFEKTCASCHRLHGRGGEVGPDLTGSNRNDLEYLIENLVDPSASVAADYRMVVVATTDGRVLNGIPIARTERALTIRTPEGTLVLPIEDLEEVRNSDASLMPEGLIESVDESELLDLIAYLGYSA